MLLLTTTGHLSGRPHTVPLLYLRRGDSLVVIASYGGRPEHPTWYHNLEADPFVEVQVRSARFRAVASTIEGPDREDLWREVVSAYSGYADYQARTDRVIPLVLLEPTGRGPGQEKAGKTSAANNSRPDVS